MDQIISAVLAVLIAQLGNNDFEMRERAHAAIARLGPAAHPHLMLAAKSRDVEVSERAKLLLPRSFGGAWTAQRIVRLRSILMETQRTFRWRLLDDDLPDPADTELKTEFWLRQLQDWEAGNSFPPDYQQRFLDSLEQEAMTDYYAQQ